MLAEPYLELAESRDRGAQAWVRLMGQLMQQDPDGLLDRPSARLTWAAASHAYPEASASDVRRAMRMCLTLLVTQLAHAPRGGRGAQDVDLLLDFLSAGLHAALAKQTRATA
jgi:hypothetical protein